MEGFKGDLQRKGGTEVLFSGKNEVREESSKVKRGECEVMVQVEGGDEDG